MHGSTFKYSLGCSLFDLIVSKVIYLEKLWLFSFSSLNLKYHHIHMEGFLVFATKKMWCPGSACCLQTGPLWMMFCVVSDCLVSYVTHTEAATTAGLSDNRALKLACLTLSPPHHTPFGSGPSYFSGAYSTIQLIQQLNSEAAFNSNSETQKCM